MTPRTPKPTAEARSSPFSRRQLVAPCILWDQLGGGDLDSSRPGLARAAFGGGSGGEGAQQTATQRPQSGRPVDAARTSTWETRVGPARAPRPVTARARLERARPEQKLNCEPLSASRSGAPAHRARGLYSRAPKSAGSSRSLGQSRVPSPPQKIIRPSTAGAVTDRSLADVLRARSARQLSSAPRNVTGACFIPLICSASVCRCRDCLMLTPPGDT